ncbi:MAG: hypothetical protein KKG96_06280 [Proteobacteria bacterium]|nr:hypothetical protein [Pseudomonadota bacterium]
MKSSNFWQALLILGLLIGLAAPLQAATGYEATGVTFSDPVTSGQFVRVTADLTVSWTAPTGVVPDPMYYYLKFSEQSTPLSDTEFNDTTNDFAVAHPVDFKTISKSFFDAYDSDKLRYLHIKTQYLNTSTASTAYSDDVISAAIRIDNVAPTGTLTLDPTSGSTNQVTVSMSPSESIKYYWLNDSSTFPGGEGTDYSLFPQGTVGLREGTAYGDVTISAWFADFAGNRSTAASASAVYTYTAAVAINHNSVFQIAVDASLGFTVDQTTLYDWTITDASVSGVAEFSGASAGVASVTVVGKKAGTFTVTATLLSGTALKTGTITVVQTSTTKQYTLLAGLNIISLSRTGTGWAKATDLITAVGTICQSVTKWNAPTQGFVTYNKALPIPSLNFDLVAGDGYFVNVTGGMSFAVTGQTITRTYSLVSGLNLVGLPESKSSITKAADLITAVGSSCQSVTKWNAETQGFVTYNKALPIPSLNFDIAVGEGYFLNVNANTDWQ